MGEEIQGSWYGCLKHQSRLKGWQLQERNNAMGSVTFYHPSNPHRLLCMKTRLLRPHSTRKPFCWSLWEDDGRNISNLIAYFEEDSREVICNRFTLMMLICQAWLIDGLPVHAITNLAQKHMV